jgi:hypothetical protein
MESNTDTSELISDVHLRFLENWMRVDEERRRKVSEAFSGSASKAALDGPLLRRRWPLKILSRKICVNALLNVAPAGHLVSQFQPITEPNN